MATESVATHALVDLNTDKNVGITLAGLLQILMRHTYSGYGDLGALTGIELVTIRNQANNVKVASLAGLHLLGDLVSCYDEKIGGSIDTNGVGWLTKTLTETVEQMMDVGSSARLELERRGYDWLGRPRTALADDSLPEVQS
jgi:hypothetical protein